MATILRYFISGTNADWLDLATPGSEFSLAGQQVISTGSSSVNAVHAALGVDLDARNLLGGEDVLVFNYRWDQYTKDLTSVSGAIVFSYYDASSGLTEKVTLLNGSTTAGKDKLVFADGAVITNNAKTALTGNLSAAITAVTGYTTSAGSTTATFVFPTPAGNTYRGFASTSNTNGQGAAFAIADAGQTLIATGSSQVDKVYVKAGAIVDARNLLGGEDLIYFSGRWDEYSKSLTAVSGAIQFTRSINGANEVVTVLNGSTTAGKDKLIFADGAVIANNAKTALTTNITAALSAVTGYDVATVTPFLSDIQSTAVTSGTGGVSGVYNVGDEIVFTVTMKTGKNVDVTTTGGVPRLAITLDSGVTAYAAFDSTLSGGTSNLSSLKFKYVVGAGQTDTNGISLVANALGLNGGAIKLAGTATDAKITTLAFANNASYVVDTTAPTFVNATTNVAGNKITLTYSEALSATTAAGSDFAVKANGSPITVSGVTVSGSTVELTLSQAIVAGQSVTVGYTAPTVNLGAANAATQDVAGTDVSSLVATTSVTNIVDTTAPTASVNSVSIPNTSNVVVQSTEVGTAYLVKSTVAVTNIASITGAADTQWNSVAISAANSNTNLSAAGLVDGTYKVYTVDAAGNLSAASTNSVTIDSAAPTVSAIVYGTNDGTLVLGEAVTLTVTLSEAVNVVGTPTLALANGGTARYTGGTGSNTLTFTYIPDANQTTADLVTAMTALTLPTGASIKDLAGNAVVSAGFNSINPTGTLAVDVTAPALTSSTPVDNATAVAVGSNIVLTFGEAVKAGTGNIVISNGTDTRNIPVTDTSQVTISGSTVTINPASSLLPNSTYNVQLASGVLKDIAGNPYAGITNETALSFATVEVAFIETAAPNTVSITNGGPYTATPGKDVFIIDAGVDCSATISGFEAGDTLEIVNGSAYAGINLVDKQVDGEIDVAAGNAMITLTDLATKPTMANESGFTATYGPNSLKYDLSESEAITLYAINQLRHAPTVWADLYGVVLKNNSTGTATLSDSDVAGKDSLVANQDLFEAALGHSVAMLTTGAISHYEGSVTTAPNYSPSNRATAAGYVWEEVGENINMRSNGSAAYTSAYEIAMGAVVDLFVDTGVENLGHRKSLLSASYADVGVGYALDSAAPGYSYYGTQNFGANESENPHLTGFVLNNTDGNFQFNDGEGLAGVTITITDVTTNTQYTTKTQRYGYWDFEGIGGHTYNISASGPGFTRTGSVTGVVLDTANVNGYNSKSVDFFSGTSWGRIDFGVGLNHAVTGFAAITGTASPGSTLSVNTAHVADQDGLGVLSYQWYVDGKPLKDYFGYGTLTKTTSQLILNSELADNVKITLTGSGSDGTDASYLNGKVFSVKVSYTDDKGVLESVYVANTVTVASTAPVYSVLNVSENAESGYIIYQPTATQGVTYTLSGADSASFLFDPATGGVAFKNLVDFESASDKKFYSITITPSSGATQNLVLNVVDGNDPLTALAVNGVAANNIVENANTTFRTKVADIVITDDTFETSYTYALGGTDKDYFELDVATKAIYLKPGVLLNYEEKSAYDLSVSVIETPLVHMPAATKSTNYKLHVVDQNEAPSLLRLEVKQSSLATGSTTTRIKVADIIVQDDALGTNTLSLVGADAETMFELVDADGEKAIYLKAGVALDYAAKARYDVAVQVVDSALGSKLATAYTFKVLPNGLPVEVTDLQGNAHSLLIGGLGAGWTATTFGVTRYNTALAVATDGTTRKLYTLDIATGSVMASRDLEAGEYVFAGMDGAAGFYIGTVDASKCLTLTNYAYLPGATSITASGSAVTLPVAFATTPSFSSATNYYADDKVNGVGLAYVIANGNIYAQNTPTVGTNNAWTTTALPSLSSLDVLIYKDKNFWINGSAVNSISGLTTDAYYKIASANWAASSATTSSVTADAFTAIEASVLRVGSIARVGTGYIDMYARLNSANTGLIAKINDGDVVSLGGSDYLIRAHVASQTSARGYDQWLLVKSGAVVRDVAFNSNQDAVVRTVIDTNDAGGVWLQVLNATPTTNGFTGQSAAQSLTLYRLTNAQLADESTNGALAYAANYGATALADLATTVRSYSVSELTGGRSLQSGETLLVKQVDQAAAGTNYSGYVIAELVNYTTAKKTNFFGHLDATGAVDKVFALPAPVMEITSIGTLGRFILTEADAEGIEHAYLVDSSTGSLTEISAVAYRNIKFDPGVIASLESGSDTSNTLGSSEATAAKLLVAGDGNDIINAGLGHETIGAGLGDDTLVYVTQATLVGDAIDGGQESATTDTLKLMPTQSSTAFDLGAAEVRHIDAIALGSDNGISVTISGATAKTADFNNNGMLGDIAVVATTGTQAVGTDGANLEKQYELKQGVVIGAAELGANESLYVGAYTTSNGAVYSFGGNDVMTGGNGADSIDAGNGNDTITGGLGADDLLGGFGADTFRYTSQAELIGDRVNGTAEQSTIDTVLLAPQNNSEIFNLTAADQFAYIDQVVFGADRIGTKLVFDGNVSTTLSGVSTITKYGIAASANFNGDTTLGDIGVSSSVALTNSVDIDARALSTTQSLVMNGANFNGYDLIYGGAGNDEINAGAGNDVIHAGAGNDLIVFGSGVDVLYGDAGSDTFQAATSATGRMVLSDFNKATDKLDLHLLGNLSSLSLKFESANSAADTLITVMNGATATGLQILVSGQSLSTFAGYTQTTTVAENTWTSSQSWIIG